MQASEVKERLPLIQERISDADRLCELSASASEQLKQAISDLNARSSEAEQSLQDEEDEESIIQCVDELEELSDRALQACRESGDSLGSELIDAVKVAHKELSDLKHQLH